MRMINADVLDKELGVSDCDISMRELVNEQPTVDAIPVEQVARMIAKFTGMPPCAFENLPWSEERLEHCTEHCGIDDSDVLCWESAIKEGWLDDAE